MLSFPPANNISSARNKVQDVTVEQFQRGFGQDHVLAPNRRQLVNRDALRESLIICVSIERQDLAAIGARRVDGFLQFQETALYKLATRRADRHGNLDAGSSLSAVLPMSGKHHCIAQAISETEPKAIVEAFYRLDLADVDIMILRGRDRVSIFPGAGMEHNKNIVTCFRNL